MTGPRIPNVFKIPELKEKILDGDRPFNFRLDRHGRWNDSFFMAMMFLLAGLFVPPALARKGAGRFVRDRAGQAHAFTHTAGKLRGFELFYPCKPHHSQTLTDPAADL